MNNILVPTDFSSFAENAFEAAIELAKIYNAQIHLFHCIPEHSKSFGFQKTKVSQHKSEEEKELVEIQIHLRKAIEVVTKSTIKAQSQISQGKLIPEVLRYIELKNIDFIVIGSHGASGKEEYFIGSNAQKMIRSVHIPVLTVKDSLGELNFDEVIYASDFHTNDKKAFQIFLELMAPFKPFIHLLAINTSGFFSQPAVILYEAMNDFQQMAEPMKSKMHFYSDFGVETGIRHFSEDIGAKLIVMSNVERHPIKRMFQGSNVEMLINHSKIPVLTIDVPV